MEPFNESNPSYRFIKSYGVLTALLEFVGVPKEPFKDVIKDASLPISMATLAKKAYNTGRESAHLAIDKNSYVDFSKYFLSLQESMTRDLSLWNKQAAPKLRSIKPHILWDLRKKSK